MRYQLLLALFFLSSMSLIAQVPSNGLVAYYPFDGNANDASGNGRNGTVTGATLATDRYGQNNKSYSFNGANNYIRISNWQTLTGNSARTISIWFKMPAPGIARAMTFWGALATNQQNWIGYINDPSKGIHYFGFEGYFNTCWLANRLEYFNDRWHHLVFTYDGTSKKLWLDAVFQVAGTTTPLNTASTELFIGSQLGNSMFFQGQLDDVRIYNRGLSDIEVLQLYQAEVPTNSAEFAKIGVNRFIHTIGLYNTSIGNMAGNTLSSSAGTNNAFIGYQTGKDNSTGSFNSFIGYRAGFANTTGSQNTLIGAETGYALSGSGNTMLGYQAGKNTSTGASNTFIGPQAGLNNTTGSNNIIIGPSSGTNVTTGNDNILMGYRSKSGDGRGSHNLILGSEAGDGNWSGTGNTLIGYRASADSPNLQNATALGTGANVSISNAIILGKGANVGIGTSAPTARLEVVSETPDASGFRLANLTAASHPTLSTDQFLTVDEKGDVVKARYQLRINSINEWSDKVFSAAYQLRPLTTVATFIKQHGHLPGVPSADQMVNEGVDLTKINATLLEKIEELTLYSIQLEKELQSSNQHQQTEIDELKRLVKELIDKK